MIRCSICYGEKWIVYGGWGMNGPYMDEEPCDRCDKNGEVVISLEMQYQFKKLILNGQMSTEARKLDSGVEVPF